MPKMKSHRGIRKRVKITARGKVVRRQAGKGHLMGGKRGKKKRHLRGATTTGASEAPRLRRMYGVK